MMFSLVVFCWIVSQVVFAAFPIIMEMFLFYESITNPLEQYVHTFILYLFQYPWQYAMCKFDVKLQWFRFLWMAHLHVSLADWQCLFVINVTATCFGFLNWTEYSINEFVQDKYMVLMFWWWFLRLYGKFDFGAKLMVSPST